MSIRLNEIITRNEPFDGSTFKNQLGIPVIGFSTPLPLTRVEAMSIMKLRIKRSRRLLYRELRDKDINPKTLPVRAWNVLQAMAYTISPSEVVKQIGLMDAVRAGEWKRAYEEAMDSGWAEGDPGKAEKIARGFLYVNK